MNADQEDLLIEISIRYEDRVSSYDVYRWLEQFEEVDYDSALEVLLKLNYFTIENIYQQFDQILPKVINRVENYFTSLEAKARELRKGSKIEKAQARNLEKTLKSKNPLCVTGIGKYGKSGAAMLYYFTHTPFYRSHSQKFMIIDNVNRLHFNGAADLLDRHTLIRNRETFLQVILIDDVIGSGRTLVKYINKDFLPQMEKIGLNKICLHICTLAALADGINYIKKNVQGAKLFFYGNIVERAFSYKSHIFGYGPIRERIKQFCVKYGQGLYNSGYPDHQDLPLGHGNSQMLVIFPHSTPNNTLPILWSNRNGWRPLFPRNVSDRIDESRRTRKEMSLWTAVAKRLNLDKYLVDHSSIYDLKNIQVLCLIKLLYEGKSLKYIVSKLGIFESELYEIIDRAIARELLTTNLKLTEYAEYLYVQVKKELRRRRQKERTFINDLLYLPKQFRGFS